MIFIPSSDSIQNVCIAFMPTCSVLPFEPALSMFFGKDNNKIYINAFCISINLQIGGAFADN